MFQKEPRIQSWKMNVGILGLRSSNNSTGTQCFSYQMSMRIVNLGEMTL